MHKEMAGVYDFLPLGKRVLDKIIKIIREEMNEIGGQEVELTALQNPTVWQGTNRWDDDAVDVWFKTQLHSDQKLGLAFTHEEPISAMMTRHVSSYKDLPCYVYQFQTKFRNEVRSKSGIMRGREFLMKDLYSFSRSQAEHDEFYEACKQAYVKVFERIGIGEITHVTLASGGSFARYSHEFQSVCDAGEDLIFHVPDTDVYYNREVAPSRTSVANKRQDMKPIKVENIPDVIGVEALIEHFNIDIIQSTKTLGYVTDDDKLILAAVRSDYEINEVKLAEVVGCEQVSLADDEAVLAAIGSGKGYLGLVNVPEAVEVFMDDSLQDLCNFETGANQTGHHAINVNFERDVPVPNKFHDFKLAKEGDVHPETGKKYQAIKAAEVGNIFSLGTKFSVPTELNFTDESGKQTPVIMGSYGIGPARTMGVVVETMSDERGLVWPAAIAPARVHLVRIGDKPEVVKPADELYRQLQSAGHDVLYDDRNERVGTMLADADLIGCPTRVVISEKSLAAGGVEVKQRTEESTKIMTIAELTELLG